MVCVLIDSRIDDQVPQIHTDTRKYLIILYTCNIFIILPSILHDTEQIPSIFQELLIFQVFPFDSSQLKNMRSASHPE